MAALKPVTFTACQGLNNVVDPARVSYDPETGKWEASKAVNVDLDYTGRPSRRPGCVQVQSGAWDSLWSDGLTGYAVRGQTLYEVSSAGLLRSIKTDMADGLPVSFVAAGGAVYWCNGAQSGKILDGVTTTWGGGTYPHADIVGDTGRVMSDPPVGHLLEYHAGRIWIAVENVVYITEGAGLYDFVCLEDGFLPFYESKVRMMRHVDDGVYVGTDQGVEFVGGVEPAKFTYRKAATEAPFPGTDIIVPGEIINQQFTSPVAVWCDTAGAKVGLPGGVVIPLTDKKVRLPMASRGAALFYNQKYLALLAP